MLAMKQAMWGASSYTRSIQILDGPRFEAGFNAKLDTSLDASLPKYAQDYSSSPDSLDFLTPEKGGCRHRKLISQAKYDTCLHCGVYVPKNGVKNYKSAKMDYGAFFPPKTIYETLTRRSYQLMKLPIQIMLKWDYKMWNGWLD